MEVPELARKWRRIEVGNSVAGLLVSVAAVLFLPSVAAAVVVGFLVLRVADTWYLGRRLSELGDCSELRAAGRVKQSSGPGDNRAQVHRTGSPFCVHGRRCCPAWRIPGVDDG